MVGLSVGLSQTILTCYTLMRKQQLLCRERGAPVTTSSTALQWVADPDPHWDDDRARVFGTVPDGVFPAVPRIAGERLTGDWWAVVADGRTVGYGWLDDVWGDAEILMAVQVDARGTGAGSFALSRLEAEATDRGLNYVVNVVRDTHPERDRVTAWLLARGFGAAEDGRLRKRVGREVGQHQDGAPGAGPARRPDGGRQARYEAERAKVAGHDRVDAPEPVTSPRGPGREDSGGYVDPEQHRY